MATTNLTAAQQATPNSGGGPSGSVTGYQLTGTWVGTVTFEGTIDGTNFVAAEATPIAGGAVVTTATTNGIWRVKGVGLQGVRARCSAFTSGTIVVTDFPSEGAL